MYYGLIYIYYKILVSNSTKKNKNNFTATNNICLVYIIYLLKNLM